MGNMKNKNIFLAEILPWYKKNARKLPWRKASISAYEVWVSEVMLQQTQAPRVAEYYAKFLKKFPTVQHLAHASWREFLPYWDGLGYYARGRNILATAKIITEKYNRKFPRDKKLLMRLPGIGDYTASAVLSFAYGESEIAFDTNFKRIFGTRAKAEKVFQTSNVSSKVFNSAVMDYGSAQKQLGQLDTERRRSPLADKDARETIARAVRAVVFLHENHKKYFSLNKKKYVPFVVPEGVSSRDEIKKYFLEKYGLKLSVRPPHKKEISDGKIVAHINAQILLGRYNFSVYNKREI